MEPLKDLLKTIIWAGVVIIAILIIAPVLLITGIF